MSTLADSLPHRGLDSAPPPAPISIRIDAELPGGSGLEPLGFLEIDRVVAGRCCGGVRMTSTVGPEELRRLASIMTLKCGFLGLASGGAKAGIVAAPTLTPAERAARVAAFGRALGPILRTGIYSFGCDLGTTPGDVSAIRRAAGLSTGEPRRSERGPTSGELAGITVALSAVAALRARGIDPRDARAAVQGAGAVGLATMAALAREGVRIVAVATVEGTLARATGLDVAEVVRAARREGDAFVRRGGEGAPPRAVLETACDVFVPCAGSATVDLEAAGALAATTVVCGANDPFAPGAEARLDARGALIVPDFVANGGGVLGSSLACAGARAEDIDALLRRHFLPRVAGAIDEAAARGEPVAEPARRSALRFLSRCEEAYGAERPPSLLPDALAPRPSIVLRALLALEARVRGSRRLEPLARRLRPLALERLDEVLESAHPF